MPWIGADARNALFYDSVADMKLGKNFDGSTVITNGYYKPNDGGGGTYIIRTKKTTDVDDGGSIHFLNDDLVAELIVGDCVTPEQFGAYGDGKHDDSGALNKCISFGNEIVGDVKKKYAIKHKVDCIGFKKVRDINIIATLKMESCLTYDSRRIILDNITVDCNNFANNGIKGSDKTPIITTYVAEVRHCTVLNAVKNGFATGAIRTSYYSCMAKYCDVGFRFETTDTTNDILTPIDCNIGIWCVSATTIVSCHPWAWDRRQIGIYIPDGASNIVINNFYNDTNQVGVKFGKSVVFEIDSIVCFNNTNAPNAIDKSSARLLMLDDSNFSYDARIIIGKIHGSFVDVDDYTKLPSVSVHNIEIGYVQLHSIKHFGKNRIKNTQFRSSILNMLKERLEVSSDVIDDNDITFSIVKAGSTQYGYKISMSIGFELKNDITLNAKSELFAIKYKFKEDEETNLASWQNMYMINSNALYVNLEVKNHYTNGSADGISVFNNGEQVRILKANKIVEYIELEVMFYGGDN